MKKDESKPRKKYEGSVKKWRPPTKRVVNQNKDETDTDRRFTGISEVFIMDWEVIWRPGDETGRETNLQDCQAL